jgi:hypothetical protein
MKRTLRSNAESKRVVALCQCERREQVFSVDGTPINVCTQQRKQASVGVF